MGIFGVNLFQAEPTLSVTGFFPPDFPLNGLCFLLNESKRRKQKESKSKKEEIAAVY